MRRLVLYALAAAAFPLGAAPRLPALFTEHMVLQQGRPIPVWGTADPDERISVSFNGTEATAQAGPDGRWRLELPPQKAGGPYTLTVDGNASVRVRDVLVGEVWIASGQSNMSLNLARASRADAASASHPGIRLFTVPKATSREPVRDIDASWQPCTPETAAGFSAVAYYFGERLHETLQVPVGLIHTSWPGTLAEEWTPRQTLEADPQLAPLWRSWQGRAATSVGDERSPRRFDLQFQSLRFTGTGAPLPLMNAPWRFGWGGAPGAAFEWQDGGNTAAISGELRGRDSAQLRIDVSRGGAPADLTSYDAIALRVRGRGSFQLRTTQPSSTDSDDYTSAPFDAAPEWRDIAVPLASLKQAGWGRKVPYTPDAIGAVVIEPLLGKNGGRPPAGLYNAMIVPLLPYGIRGAIWYQGEGNSGRALQYRTLLPAMIRAWRSGWGQGDFPFLIVQLPNYRNPSPQPQDSNWAELREAQLMALRLPQTGLAVTIDVGEAEDVHPANKRPVGERLARWALGTTYGRPGEYSGPLFESVQMEGGRARIRFRHTGSGLVSTDHLPLRGFAVAGPDRRFVWAKAEIDGDTVVVSSPDVPSPAAVRYGWADNPGCNLGNRDGLPASPFRTDDWQR